jgi:DNA-binding response OmpR family regulator
MEKIQMTAHILLVESETKLARFVEIELKSRGYFVSVTHDGIYGLSLVEKSDLDLVILNPMTRIPWRTGLELFRRLQSAETKVPVILLTTEDKVEHQITGLDIGANNYLVKPFDFEELLAKIQIHLGQTQIVDVDLLQFEDLSLNRRTRDVYRGSRSIELIGKEFELLQYLMIHPHQVFTDHQIFDNIWGCDYLEVSNVAVVHTRCLRLKLKDGNEKHLIYNSCRRVSMVSDSHANPD